jgi:tetratricopeptide (TPR) repeat protein
VTHSVAKCLSIAAVAAVLLPAALPAQTDNPDVQNITRELRADNYAQAIADADKILTDHPADCPVLTLRGIALMRQGQTSDARQSFARALQSCPQFLPALEGAAQIDYASHAPTAARLLQRILDQRPDDQTSHAMLGSLSFQHGDCAEAVQHFEKSLALIRHSEEAQREYGSCLFTQGDQRKAQEVFQQIVTENPSETNILALAYIQWKSKDSNGALRTLQPLLAATDASSRVFSLAAQVAEDAGDTPHAVEWLRTAILKAPTDPSNYLLFATISFNHASYQVGIDIVDAGLQQIPGSARLYLARGVLRVQLSNYTAAVGDFQKAHALDTKLSFAQDAMGMIRSQQHDSAGSLSIFERLAVQHPQDALLQYLYAEALSEADANSSEQNRAKAIAAVKSALKLEPDYQPARDLLCSLLLQSNDYPEVIRQAELALKSDPSDQAALYQEMQAERRLGNKQAVTTMVARLNDLKKQERVAQARYLLADSDANRVSP